MGDSTKICTRENFPLCGTWSSIEREKIAGDLLVHHQRYQVEILDVRELFVYNTTSMFSDEVVEETLVTISVLCRPVKPQHHNLLQHFMIHDFSVSQMPTCRNLF